MLNWMSLFIQFLRDNFDVMAFDFTVAQTDVVATKVKSYPLIDKFTYTPHNKEVRYKGKALLLCEDGQLHLYNRANSPNGWSSTHRVVSLGEAILEMYLTPYKILSQLRENSQGREIYLGLDMYNNLLYFVFDAMAKEVQNNVKVKLTRGYQVGIISEPKEHA